MELGILSGPGVLFLDNCFRHISYVLLVKLVEMGTLGVRLCSNMNPVMLCQGCCLTLQVQVGGGLLGIDNWL